MLTLEELKERLVDMGFEESIVFEEPGYIAAVKGIDSDGRVIYDYNLMAESLVDGDGMTLEDAEEFIEYNVIRALSYMGEGRPIIMYSDF